jgi:heat shock protein HtpX
MDAAPEAGHRSPRAARLQRRNRIQAAALFGGMLVVAGALAHLLLGPLWIPWLVGVAGLSLLAAPRLSPAWLMRLSGAVPLHPRQAPQLYAVLEALSRRAGLPRLPVLYWVPRGFLNAFAVGTADDAAIAVTEGLLRTLTPRELAGVIAHEVAHVRSGDMRVMLLAEMVARITGTFATLGVLLAVLNLPLVMAGAAGISWWAILLLTFSPTLSVMLQLALSRSRERTADLGAVELTGDPRALASALRKIGRFQEGLLESLWFRHRHGPESAWWKTHPATEERVRTLLDLEVPRESEGEVLTESDLVSLLRDLPARSQRQYFVR